MFALGKYAYLQSSGLSDDPRSNPGLKQNKAKQATKQKPSCARQDTKPGFKSLVALKRAHSALLSLRGPAPHPFLFGRLRLEEPEQGAHGAGKCYLSSANWDRSSSQPLPRFSLRLTLRWYLGLAYHFVYFCTVSIFHNKEKFKCGLSFFVLSGPGLSLSRLMGAGSPCLQFKELSSSPVGTSVSDHLQAWRHPAYLGSLFGY